MFDAVLSRFPLAVSLVPGYWSLFPLLVGTAALIVARRNVRGTTLTATWWWSLTALLATCGVELLEASSLLGDEAAAAAWRYAARALLLCPAVSLVGAKRPQDGPWNFVVLSLWGVLALPAAESLFLRQPLAVHDFRSWFVLILILLTLANTLPTRHAAAALLAVLGQTLLLAEYLPFRVVQPTPWLTAMGAASLAGTAVLFALRPPRSSAATPLDRLWLDFRDTFGLFWGLRIEERLAATAKMHDWPITLRWTGWRTREGQPLREEPSAGELRAILIAFRGLLRRFVSNEWIEQRLEANS